MHSVDHCHNAFALRVSKVIENAFVSLVHQQKLFGRGQFGQQTAHPVGPVLINRFGKGLPVAETEHVEVAGDFMFPQIIQGEVLVYRAPEVEPAVSAQGLNGDVI